MSIRLLPAFFFLFISSFSALAHADTLYAEEKMNPLPTKVEQAIRDFVASGMSAYTLGECALTGKPLRLSGHPSRDAYFVGTRGCGGGSAALPFWIVDISGQEPKVLLSEGATVITQTKQDHHGLNDLRLESGNAGSAYVEYYTFNGTTYEPDKKRSWSFPANCSDQDSNPDHQSSCNRDSYLNYVTSFFPPQMLYAGKPVDPTCVYAAIHRKGNGVELKNSCDDIKSLHVNADETPVTQSYLIITPDESLGYEYDLEDGRTGEFFYKYIGTTKEGVVLNVYYSSGGSGHFSDLGVYGRDKNTFRKIRTIQAGDRCSGGVLDASIEDDNLLYSYYVTLPELYQKYIPNSPYRSDLGGGFIDCTATINMKDDKIQSVEFSDRASVPDCFKKEYEEATRANKILSNSKTQNLIEKLSKACPLNKN